MLVRVAFIDALEYLGVDVVLSKFDESRDIATRTILQARGKQTTCNCGRVVRCYEAGIERVLLVTADSDQMQS
jgi:hypothetical protein